VLQDVKELLQTFVDPHTQKIQSGIIYCLSRNECEEVAAALKDVKHPAADKRAHKQYRRDTRDDYLQVT
jgi:superfamily II DNA helicase RecQ